MCKAVADTLSDMTASQQLAEFSKYASSAISESKMLVPDAEFDNARKPN
ncbi:MAG TPA: hypothetical protein VI386_17715 [Candidatus Sulfotelmatobacter sp.]